jgi:hypothetical protein
VLGDEKDSVLEEGRRINATWAKVIEAEQEKQQAERACDEALGAKTEAEAAAAAALCEWADTPGLFCLQMVKLDLSQRNIHGAWPLLHCYRLLMLLLLLLVFCCYRCCCRRRRRWCCCC